MFNYVATAHRRPYKIQAAWEGRAEAVPMIFLRGSLSIRGVGAVCSGASRSDARSAKLNYSTLIHF